MNSSTIAGTQHPDRLLTARATAKRLGVARSTLYRWLADGKLAPSPRAPVVRRNLFDENELARLVDHAAPEPERAA